MKEYIDQLLEYPLFDGIKEEELGPMLGCLGGHIKTFRKGEYIFLEQEVVNHIGLIISGSIDMVKEDVWGNKTIMVRIKERDLFGESFACGLNQSSIVTFCASSDSKIMFLPFQRVMHSCSRSCGFHHRLIENMVFVIAAKNKQLMEKIEVVSKKTLREKILAYLSQQAQVQGTEYFELPLGRVEMAEYLCADRSALTRELNLMQDEGLIDYHRNTFRLL